MLDKSQNIMPGGVNSPVRSFKAVGGQPPFIRYGTGPWICDVDDNKYIDYVSSWGAIILGHNNAQIRNAVQTALANGLSFGAPTEAEIQLAELIVKNVPSIEMLRMVSSGTEATSSAIRLARGYTKKNKIIKFAGCYHGHNDSLLVKSGSGNLTLSMPDSAGIPTSLVEHTLVAPYNDWLATEKLFAAFPEDIAAVIVEPIAANMNLVLPQEDFLPKLRELCNQYNSVLIFDEVITGFRVSLGGAQELYNIQPDITCLGKIIGGGMPVGAFGGKREIFSQLAPLGPVYQVGRYSIWQPDNHERRTGSYTTTTKT